MKNSCMTGLILMGAAVLFAPTRTWAQAPGAADPVVVDQREEPAGERPATQRYFYCVLQGKSLADEASSYLQAENDYSNASGRASDITRAARYDRESSGFDRTASSNYGQAVHAAHEAYLAYQKAQDAIMAVLKKELRPVPNFTVKEFESLKVAPNGDSVVLSVVYTKG
jgi:hypothetical protein